MKAVLDKKYGGPEVLLRAEILINGYSLIKPML